MTTVICLPKPPLQKFIETCTPLAIIDALEEEMRARVDNIASALLDYRPSNDPVENLARFLQADANFLGIVLALTNLSQEKFLRILSAERFAKGDFGVEWTIKRVALKLKTEFGFAELIAQLFLEGRSSQTLIEQVAGFYLDQLSLPADWGRVIRDPQLVQNVIRRKLTGEYTDRKGDAVEAIIREYLDMIYEKYGVTHEKGQVRLSGIGKEADHAIPTTTDPFVMVMTSYMETTSSSQTTRANEQSGILGKIHEDNIRYGTTRAFVNFVDGAGWLARRSDLRKMHAGCDYIINLKTLDRLEAIICKHVPGKYFTTRPRPQVVEG